MSKLFCKHLHLCFFKLKYPTPTQSPSPEHHHHTHNKQDTSLYDVASSSAHSTCFKSTEEEEEEDQLYLFSSSSDSDTWEQLPPPDLATVISSHRFFFSSPGRSNSIIEYTRPCNNNSFNKTSLIPKGGVGVTKNSLDPYMDFRRSMQEMIDSRDNSVDVRRDWDYLHELLLCYVALNHPHNHKYIVRAFTDLVVDLLSSTPQPRKRCHCQRQGSFSAPLIN